MPRLLALAVSLAIASPALADNTFRWVAEPIFQDAGSAYQGVVPLKQGELWGLMNGQGEWIWPPQFQAVGTPGLGGFPVEKDGKWGVVTIDGQTPTPFDYDSIGTPQPYTPMQYQGAWYALGPDAQWVEPPLPIDTLTGNEGSCITGLRAGVPVMIWLGEEPRTTAIDGISAMDAPSEGNVAYVQGGRAGHLDCESGTTVNGGAENDEVRRFSEGLAAVRNAVGWVYADTYSSVAVSGDFQAAKEFSEGIAPVQDRAGLWGYIDRTGQFVIPAQFDQAYSFADGLAGVQIGDKRGFITPDGRFAVDPQFDDFWRHDGGIVPVQQGGLWGVIAPAATDPATRMNLPLDALAAMLTGSATGFTLQPSNPHYYVAQDIASLHSIHVTEDEKVMVTTLALDQNAEVALWDFTTKRLIRKFPLPFATQAVVVPGRDLLAVGLSTGQVLVLDAVTGAELYRIRPHKAAVVDMVVSPDAQWLASSDGSTVQLWETETGEAGASIATPAHKLRFSRDSASIYAGTIRGGLVHMTLLGEDLARIEEGPARDTDVSDYPQAVPAMALSPDGMLVNLRSVLEQGTDTYYHPRYWLEIVTETGTRQIDMAAGIRDILTLDVSADGKFVAYAGQRDGNYVAVVEMRDLASGEVVFSQTLDRNEQANAAGLVDWIYSIDRLSFVPDGGLVLVGSEGQSIVLLDPVAGKVTASFAEPLTLSQNGAAMLDGNRYFSSDGGGRVWIWDLENGALDSIATVAETGFGTEEMIEPAGGKFYLYSGLEEGVVQGFDMSAMQPIPLTDAESVAIAARMDFDSSVPLPDDIQAGLQARLGETGNSHGVAMAGGRIAVISEYVGVNRAYDLKTGALLAQFLATPDGEWLVVTPEGFFAASPKGARLVSVSNGLRAFSVDQVYQALYRPDLVRAKLAGDPDGEVAKAAAELDLGIILGSGPAPVTRFSFPREGSKATEPEIEIEIELQDEGGGVGRVEWRLNGMTVAVQSRGAEALDSDSPKATTRVALEPGLNEIEVVAYNAAGLLASVPQKLTVQWDGVASTEPPALYVLAVGVNDYSDGRLQLKYAAADATAFGAAMEKAGTGLFSSVSVTTLLDQQVTKANLDAAFTDLGTKVKSQDVFLFFLAGHGKTIEGKYYFIPQDFRFEGDDPIRKSGIDQDRWQEWAARVKAKKSVMIYDTCESGSITGSRSVDAAMAQTAAVERLTRAMGRTILSASTDDAPALEGYQGHGVMTWALLDAMAKGDANGNATIEVTELASYLDVKVPEISAAAFGMRQVPQMSIKGSDFALGAMVKVLGSVESFPATLTHVVAGGTEVRDAPDGTKVMAIDAGIFFGVFRIDVQGEWARIAKDGAALGWVPVAALTPLQ